MPDFDALDERLRAVERALTGTDADLTDLEDGAALRRELETVTAQLDEVQARVDELDAATQALRGYVGNVRAVNESVERRADAALAKAESLESDVRDAPTDDVTGRMADCRGSTAETRCDCDRSRTRPESPSDDDARGLRARLADALSRVR